MGRIAEFHIKSQLRSNWGKEKSEQKSNKMRSGRGVGVPLSKHKSETCHNNKGEGVAAYEFKVGLNNTKEHAR